jgi:hypothetical protein
MSFFGQTPQRRQTETVSGTHLRCRSSGSWRCLRLASNCGPAGRQDRAVKTLTCDCQEINQKLQQCAVFDSHMI